MSCTNFFYGNWNSLHIINNVTIPFVWFDVLSHSLSCSLFRFYISLIALISFLFIVVGVYMISNFLALNSQ